MPPRKLSETIFAGPALRAQPDRRLVALAREGHDAATEEIVRRYRPSLLRYAASIVPWDRADDVVQESLARALPAIGSGEAELHLRPWLYTIVRNAAFNNLRDAPPPWEHLDENYDGVEQPPQALERRERMRSLLAGLRGLPEAQRKALVKREMEGHSHADIGADLGVSEGAARQLIFRARTALREGIGALVPMPLLRQLLEGGGTGGATIVGSGAAVKVVAVLATGAAVTAGMAIKDSHRRPTPPPSAGMHAENRGGSTVAASGSKRDFGLTAFVEGRHGSARRSTAPDGGATHVTTDASKPTARGPGQDGGSQSDHNALGGTGHGDGEHQNGSQSGDNHSVSGSGDNGSGSPSGGPSASDGQDGHSGTNDGSGDTPDSSGDGSSGGSTGTPSSNDGSGSGASTLLAGQD